MVKVGEHALRMTWFPSDGVVELALRGKTGGSEVLVFVGVTHILYMVPID